MSARAVQGEEFKSVCREWRRFRKFSQLDLALAANVSQRHVSWLETGKSQPSREMVVRLSEALDMPLRERNVMLQAAGFAAAFAEHSLTEPVMAPVLAVLQTMLEHHEPLPAFVIDRCWNVKLKNTSASRLLQIGVNLGGLDPTAEGRALNLAELTLHPNGLRRFVSNWEQAAPPFVLRLRRERLACVDRETQAELDRLIALAGPIQTLDTAPMATPPALPLELTLGDLRLSLFGVVSAFGSPQDITVDELRVESMYAADEPTRDFFLSQAEGGRAS